MIKDDFLQQIVQLNFIPALITIFLLFFLLTNVAVEKKLLKQVMPCVWLLVLLMLVDNLDYYAYDHKINNLFHRLTAMLGYDIRLFLMGCLMNIAYSRRSDKRKFIVFIPAVLNTIIIFPCLFTDIVFYYKDNGEIGRGPLAFTPHIICAVNLIFLLILAVKCFMAGKKVESGLLFLCSVFSAAAVLVELLFSLRGILVGVIALDIFSYYLYLHIEHYKYDNLTGLYNRETFFSDIKRWGRNRISHIMSIDANNLKFINDNYGHQQGDRMLISVSESMSRVFHDGYRVYRIGGDEFAVLCLQKTEREIDMDIEKVNRDMKENYTIAIGYSRWNDGESYHDAFKRADKQMYENKVKIKTALLRADKKDNSFA